MHSCSRSRLCLQAWWIAVLYALNITSRFTMLLIYLSRVFHVNISATFSTLGSRPLVTPYYCRLGDLLCLFVYPLFVYYFVCVCICAFCVFFVFWGVVFLCSSLLQYFDTVGWVFWSVKNRRLYNLYCVGADVKPCSINQSIHIGLISFLPGVLINFLLLYLLLQDGKAPNNC